MIKVPTTPSAYCEDQCEWYQLVPNCVHLKRYCRVLPGAIGHSTTCQNMLVGVNVELTGDTWDSVMLH